MTPTTPSTTTHRPPKPIPNAGGRLKRIAEGRPPLWYEMSANTWRTIIDHAWRRFGGDVELAVAKWAAEMALSAEAVGRQIRHMADVGVVIITPGPARHPRRTTFTMTWDEWEAAKDGIFADLRAEHNATRSRAKDRRRAERRRAASQ